jgi:hypothetical protein
VSHAEAILWYLEQQKTNPGCWNLDIASSAQVIRQGRQVANFGDLPREFGDTHLGRQ